MKKKKCETKQKNISLPLKWNTTKSVEVNLNKGKAHTFHSTFNMYTFFDSYTWNSTEI